MYKNIMCWISAIIFFLFGCMESYGEEVPTLWQKDFCVSFQEMEAGRFLHLTRSAIVDSDILSIYDSRTAILAILEYFVQGRRNFELYWFKSHNRAGRAFMLALYYCVGEGVIPEIPDFPSHIDRLNERERQERHEELAFVLQYRAALAKRIANILKKRNPMNAATDARRKFEPVGTSWQLTPLPTWCGTVEGESR